MKALTFLIVLLMCSTNLYSAGSIHYYDLTKRPAEEVIPLIQPFLEPQEAISGDGYQLFIKATATRAQEIEELIANIDKAADIFKISVSNDQNLFRARDSISGSAKIESGDTTIQVGKPRDKDSSVSIQADSTTRNNQNSQTQFVQVQEGKPAFISTSTLRIIPIHSYIEKPNGDYIIEGYYPTDQNGFFAIVRSPDNKTANVSLQSVASSNSGRKSYHGYGQPQTYLNTTLQVPIGKWFEVGGIDQSSSSSSSGILSRSNSNKETSNNIFMKVDIVN
ncbi:MAG: hypothetical protein AAGB35_05605 [Pseudomonadota bacterium]